MTRRAARGLLIYAILVLVLASWRALQVHSAPFDCSDDAGHGPDAGTSECEGAIRHARERRTHDTRSAFIAVTILGAFGLGAYGAVRLSMRISSVRGWADHARGP